MNYGQIGNSINEQMVQQWVAEKRQAEACYAQKERDKPMMDVEYDRLSQSIAELHGSVTELIARIAPVCQPGGLERGVSAQDSAAKQIEATPSDLRSKLMDLRLRVEAISGAIAQVKYRIEI